GEILFDRVFDRETALFDELNGSGRGNRLGHRRDPEQCIQPKGTGLADVGNTKCALIDNALAIRRHDDDTRDVLALDCTTHCVIDRGRGLGLLCIGDKRQSSRAADKGDELTPLHWIVLPLGAAKLSGRGGEDITTTCWAPRCPYIACRKFAAH